MPPEAKKKKTRKIRTPKVWTEVDFEVKKSTIRGAGQGLFTKVLIHPGDTIGAYEGKILTDAEANRAPYVNSLYLVWVCKDCWIWGEGRYANYTRFINHDDRWPSAELITSNRWKKARIAAIRTIRPGEEIFFDYGESYWDVVDIEKVARNKRS
ncbi:MAG: SET domain-containing protein-lysine N-methyltransferase [Verrucomicrobiota bacterium]